jgi:hypothetical protein
VIELSRKPYAYGTSHRLDEVVIEDRSGARTTMLRKDLGAAEKPEFLHDPRRERQAYEVLAGAGLGTPACQESGDGWLLLEKVDGVELWQLGELDSWIEVARWLSRLHSRFDAALPVAEALLSYDAGFFRIWPERAAAKHPTLSPLVAGYDRVVEILTRQPLTFIHGEFYASNVIVAPSRVAPVDWEMAGIGPGVLDVAALLSGWGDAQRASILAGYGVVPDEALAAARLHIAMQWLGWSPGWTPPPEHAKDWLTEALHAAHELGI